jgi:hypothetical protein
LLEDRVVPSTLDTLKTVYAPGETAVLHLSGLAAGETVALQVTRTDSGTGTPQVSPTWLATDGGVGDFDHTANGQITFDYRVPSDVTLATFQITATGTVSRSTAAITIKGDSSSNDVLDSEPPPPQTTTTVTSSAATAASGQAVTFTATVASDSVVNSGDVQFLVDGFDFGDPVPVVNGQATSSAISSLTAANHTITATFDDDSETVDASEGSLTQVVTGNQIQDYTLAWVEVQPQDVAPGQFATITAGAFQLGETVDFQITNLTNGHTYAPFSVTDGSSNDLDNATDGHVQTMWQVPADALNCQLQITATGESSLLSAVSTFADAQLPTTTTLTPSANPSTYGSSVTFTATVTASSTVNTGSVTFLDGATTLATVNVNASGKATFATSALTAGPHTITANYTDGVSFANSTGTLAQSVNQFPLWVTANSTSKAEGNSLAFPGTEFSLAGAAGVRRPILFNGDTLTSVTLTSTGATAAAEDGSYAIVPSAAVGTGLSNYAITYVPGTLTVLEPAITVTATSLTAINEGDPSAPVEVATFTHANGVESAGHFSATVDWGVAGHHADPGTITEDGGGTYHVAAARPVFAEQGNYTLSVSVKDNDAGANIGQNFAGLTANDDIAQLGGFFVPPDQGSAVGPNHYVEMINLIYAIYNKDGSVAVPATPLSTFYANAGVPGLGTAISDPRIIYDQASQRWFAVIITTESNNNSVVVAVSQTSDPTGAWKATRFVANNIANNFADFPTIAIDANALYIASNNFLNLATFDGISLTTIPKADLLNPAGPVVANRSHFENLVGGGSAGTQPFTFAPVSAFDGRDHGVILSTDRFSPATVLHRYDVTNPASPSATLSADNPITVPTYWNNQNAHEPDGTRTLNSGDFRMGENNVYQVGNIIWTADSILTSAATGIGAYDAIRWYEIDESTNTLLQSGTISDPHHDYIYPAIAANAAGDVVIGFSATGDSTTSDYPGAWYVTGTTTGGVTTFGTPTALVNGSSNYNITAGGRNRFGDFSAISVDPNNPNAFWIANETVVPGNPAFTTRTQMWGTQMSELVFGNTASASNSLTVNEPAINGSSATLPPVVAGQGAASLEVATFTHANGVEPAGDFTATVNWGIAGHTADATTVTEDGSGTYHVSATRPVFPGGTFTVQISISEDNASTTVTDTQEVGSVFALNPTATGALTISGNASITVPGAVVVDSSAASALVASGNAVITAGGVEVVGGVSNSGNAHVVKTGTPSSTADPLALANIPASGNFFGAVSVGGNTTMPLQPGIYNSISASGNATLNLSPGIYYIQGGGFTVTGNASVIGSSGVLIYDTVKGSVNGGITLSGNGTFNLKPFYTSGPYANVLIFQPAANTRALSISGNAMLGVTGIIYAPTALLNMSGNAQLGSTANPVSLVVNTLNLSGNINLAETAAGNDVAGDATGVANTLLAGNLAVYVNNANGYFTAGELAAIQDAVSNLDTLLVPYSVTISLVSDSSTANVTLDAGTSSASGGMADGVLGCFNPVTGEITILEGWSWYDGADPTLIGAGQYDFETTVTHELGHALGLGHNANSDSPMNSTLATAAAHRTMTVPDLNIPDPPAGADPLMAAGFRPEGAVAAASTGNHAVAVTTAAPRETFSSAAIALSVSVGVPGAGTLAEPVTHFSDAAPNTPLQLAVSPRSAALDRVAFASGSTAADSLPTDADTVNDAVVPDPLDAIFQDWSALPAGRPASLAPVESLLMAPREGVTDVSLHAAAFSELLAVDLNSSVPTYPGDVLCGTFGSPEVLPFDGVVLPGEVVEPIAAALGVVALAQLELGLGENDRFPRSFRPRRRL